MGTDEGEDLNSRHRVNSAHWLMRMCGSRMRARCWTLITFDTKMISTRPWKNFF